MFWEIFEKVKILIGVISTIILITLLITNTWSNKSLLPKGVNNTTTVGSVMTTKCTCKSEVLE
jgi:hypothetical protein